MNTTWLLYDEECPFCNRMVNMFRTILEKRNCKVKPLQNKTVMNILRINDSNDVTEIKIIGDDKKIYGGAKGIIFLSKKIWWAWPLWALAHLPLTMNIINYIYILIAKNRQRKAVCDI